MNSIHSRTADQSMSVMSLVEKNEQDGQNLAVRRRLVRRLLWKDFRRFRLKNLKSPGGRFVFSEKLISEPSVDDDRESIKVGAKNALFFLSRLFLELNSRPHFCSLVSYASSR